jgi:ATP-binding cassette subfamily B protein
VIENGKIVEQGNHGELMDEQGRYYNMFFNQFKNVEIAVD